MTETQGPARKVRISRSVVKAITYRALIVVLDFATIYLITGRLKIAVGFMIISNLYTTFAYVVHERVWARIRWGIGGTERGLSGQP